MTVSAAASEPDPSEPFTATAGPFDPSTEIGRAYLGVNWAGTPLGDLPGWDDSLNSTVRMMLASRFSMWMGWGPQLTFFCNESYRRDSLGGKYPWALGRPTAEVWSEIWDQLTDRVDAVTVAGESTWDDELQLFVQRNGYIEETFHTFSYSPLTAGAGAIVGLLCVVNEVTDSVVNARRIAAVSDLNARLATAVTEREVYDAAQTALTAHPAELPFIAAYVIDHRLSDQRVSDQRPGGDGSGRSGGIARLAWTCGVEAGCRLAPLAVDMVSGAHPWATAAAMDDVADLDAAGLFDDLPLDGQGSRPDRAVGVAITRVGGRDKAVAEGFLVVAPSAHRPWDDGYAAFVTLVAGQVGAALARARAFATERDQVAAVAAREHAIAAQLQASLLPAHEFTVDHLDVASIYRAGVEGTAVGGDWYDVIDLGPGRTALVIGDVMGRGVQAASVMGQLRAAVRAYARLELAPDVVLGLLDETVRELGPNRIVTCVYAVYDPADHSLTYANAGHLPPLLTLPRGITTPLPGGGPPLGTGRGWPTSETVTLPVGATLTLYTDGVIERRDTDLADGITTLATLLTALLTPPLSAAIPTPDLRSLPDHVVSQLMPDGSDDDIALLVARVSDRADDDRIARLSVDRQHRNVAEARQMVTDHAPMWGIDLESALDAELIVSELVTNAFVHAHTDVVVTMRVAGTSLYLEVHDDVPTSPQPRNALPSDTNGRGLAIVATLARRWGTRLTPRGKAVWCEITLADQTAVVAATGTANVATLTPTC